MKRLFWLPFLVFGALLLIYAARLGWQASVADSQERAWSCGYAQGRCDWGHDAAFCESVAKTCDGLEWVTEGRIQ